VAEPALVEIRGIGKLFGTGTTALGGVDLMVAPGEFLSILGPSGCGKSTLLRIVAGLSGATSGTIRRAHELAGRTAIGYVFQDPTLMPWADVARNVALPLALSGVATAVINDRLASVLAQVGLDGFSGAYPRALSGGMRMRVAIARALIAKPRLLLMDEPFAALDEITRFRLNEDLLALWQAERFTVVFVTHSVFEAAFLSTRVAVMTGRPGRIAEECVVPLSHPREAALRTSAEYGAFCRRLSDALARASGP